MSQRGARERPAAAVRERRTARIVKAAGLSSRAASSDEELEAAHSLVRRRYAWRGYETAAHDAARAAAAREEREITFLATEEDRTVGTITLGLDGPDGLLAEGTHAEAVHRLRARGRHVCELTRLAVAERTDTRVVLASLFSLAYAAGTLHGVTDVFIEVNPRHVGFYTRVLGFVVAAAARICERVRAPSVLLWLEIERLEQKLLELNSESSAALAVRAA